jgi:hypothetical protein
MTSQRFVAGLVLVTSLILARCCQRRDEPATTLLRLAERRPPAPGNAVSGFLLFR